jgi:hypothetical protein
MPDKVAKTRKNTKKPAKSKAKRGPREEILKLEWDWQENVHKAFQVKKPTTGWPKE